MEGGDREVPPVSPFHCSVVRRENSIEDRKAGGAGESGVRALRLARAVRSGNGQLPGLQRRRRRKSGDGQNLLLVAEVENVGRGRKCGCLGQRKQVKGWVGKVKAGRRHGLFRVFSAS